MAATYDPTLATPKDHARLALGDTDTTAALLDDTTIQAKLDSFGYCEALAQLAEALAVEYAQRPAVVGDNGQRFEWPDRVKAWKDLAAAARSGKIAVPDSGQAPRSQFGSGQLRAGRVRHQYDRHHREFRSD